MAKEHKFDKPKEHGDSSHQLEELEREKNRFYLIYLNRGSYQIENHLIKEIVLKKIGTHGKTE